LDEAFKKLYATADEGRRVALKQLEDVLRAAPETTQAEITRTSPFPTLRWILSNSTTPERSAAAVFQEFQRQESVSAGSAGVAWAEFSGFLTYLGAVLVILVVVVTMYAVFMVPKFRTLYRGLGSELPGLTQFAFGGGGSVFTVLLLGSLVLLIFFAWFVYALRRRLRRYTPMHVRFQKVPLVGPVVLAYNQYLWLSCARLLTVAGVSATEALRVAAERSNLGDFVLEKGGEQGRSPRSSVQSDLIASAQMGKLNEELQFQQDAAVDTFLTALGRCRRGARVVLTICTYILVATFVSAMYLPIFSLGSNI
jgi:type IV pilus assembly protein PilC